MMVVTRKSEWLGPSPDVVYVNLQHLSTTEREGPSFKHLTNEPAHKSEGDFTMIYDHNKFDVVWVVASEGERFKSDSWTGEESYEYEVGISTVPGTGGVVAKAFKHAICLCRKLPDARFPDSHLFKDDGKKK
jgi:hypothetical protein